MTREGRERLKDAVWHLEDVDRISDLMDFCRTDVAY